MIGMIGTIRRCPAVGCTARLVRTAALLFGVVGGVAGCGTLDVSDPTAIEESELNDATGAALFRAAVISRLSDAADDATWWSGLLADEFLYGGTAGSSDLEMLDRREREQFEALRPEGRGGAYNSWQDLRYQATAAMPKLRAYAPAPDAKVGEMFALRGYAVLRLAEDFCPGFPLNTVVDGKPVYSPPISTDDALAMALADFDSAMVYAADSARIVNFARVGRARTLLDLGRVAEAADAATDVPTDYVFLAEYRSANGVSNSALAMVEFDWGGFFLRRSVADREGTTGLDFVSASDPRAPTTFLGTAADGTGIYGISKYPDRDAPIVLASGIEVRLIEAEAALQDGGDWLGMLNALRTTCTDVATCPDPAPAGSGAVDSLPPLTEPGTEAARVDLLFRERAFWLFATGHRLADLRRLITHYDRPAETVFPTGDYRLGGLYGAATSIPFPAEREALYNPAITGCTSR